MLKSKKSEKNRAPVETRTSVKVRFEIYGEEMIEKTVMRSGNSGRVYLPPHWDNRHVKIIRMD